MDVVQAGVFGGGGDGAWSADRVLGWCAWASASPAAVVRWGGVESFPRFDVGVHMASEHEEAPASLWTAGRLRHRWSRGKHNAAVSTMQAASHRALMSGRVNS